MRKQLGWNLDLCVVRNKISKFLKFATKLIFQTHIKIDWNPCFSKDRYPMIQKSKVKKRVLDWEIFESLNSHFSSENDKDFKSFQCEFGGRALFQIQKPGLYFYVEK